MYEWHHVVTDLRVTAEDAGTITCSVIIDGVGYTSEPFTLQASSECVSKLPIKLNRPFHFIFSCVQSVMQLY